MINLGEAYRKNEQKTVRATRSVVARQADNEKTNKRRTMNEEKTNKRRTMNEEKTNNERRKDKAKVEIRRRLLVEFIL